MVKDVQNIFIWVKKRLVLGVLNIEEIRDKNHETGLNKGGGISMSTTVLSIYAMHALLRFEILTLILIIIHILHGQHHRLID